MKASMITSIGLLVLGSAVIIDKLFNNQVNWLYGIGAILIIIGTLMYFKGKR